MRTSAIAATFWWEEQFQIPVRSIIAAGAALVLSGRDEDDAGGQSDPEPSPWLLRPVVPWVLLVAILLAAVAVGWLR